MGHLILLLPIIGLVVFLIWPVSLALPVYLVILAISGYVYFLILKAMRRPKESGQEELLGKSAEVIEMSGHQGQVRVEGAIWHAVSDDVLRQGDRAIVIGVDGLTLRLHHISRSSDPSGTDESHSY